LANEMSEEKQAIDLGVTREIPIRRSGRWGQCALGALSKRCPESNLEGWWGNRNYCDPHEKKKKQKK